MSKNNNSTIIFLSVFSFLFCLLPNCLAQETFLVKDSASHIKCSVNYAVVPKIRGDFQSFSGKIKYDAKNIAKNSVEMSIKTESIKTGRESWDKIIRSKRLLDSKQFPLMTFKSKKVFIKDGKYNAIGIISLHGISREMTFPFEIQKVNTGKDGYLLAKGIWKINRKLFDVIWHKQLDKGGIIVGDWVTIDWQLTAVK